MPRPLDAANIIELTTRKAKAMGNGLSPANSAAFRMIVRVTPTLVSTLPKQPPKNRPAMAVLIRIEPLSSTVFAIVVASGSDERKGTPATSEIPIAIIGSASIVGNLRVIIRATQIIKIAKIPIACTIAII